MAEMRLLSQPHGTWVCLETLKLASRYLDQLENSWVSLKVFFKSAIEHLGHISHAAPGTASRFLDQLWNTWVSLKVFRSAMEYLGQPQGTWISYETLGSASRFSDQPWNTWVSLKVRGSTMEHLGQPQGFVMANPRTLKVTKVLHD
jgi:hypothetical protein